MEKDEKITLWSERIHEFQFSGQTCKTWCQEHHVPVRIFITNAIRIEVMPECPPELFRVLIHGLNDSITVTGCFTHARRRFDAALTALKKDFTKEQLKETVASGSGCSV